MGATASTEPTVEELVSKALEVNMIDAESADDLRGCDDLEEALGVFYGYMTDQGEDPDVLLADWGIIERGDAKVPDNRLLYKGTGADFAKLVARLHEGEVLMGTWVRTPVGFPKVELVDDEHSFGIVERSVVTGYYDKLRWYASRTASVNPIDYGMFDR